MSMYQESSDDIVFENEDFGLVPFSILHIKEEVGASYQLLLHPEHLSIMPPRDTGDRDS